MRGVIDIGGFRDIRRMQSAGCRSIPKLQTSGYLELYMLQKERERLLTEESLLTRRHERNQKRLAEIQIQMQGMEGLTQAATATPPAKRRGEGPSHKQKTWKTVPLNY
jgi:hypothetical protein